MRARYARRAAWPLWAGEEEIHPFYLARSGATPTWWCIALCSSPLPASHVSRPLPEVTEHISETERNSTTPSETAGTSRCSPTSTRSLNPASARGIPHWSPTCAISGSSWTSPGLGMSGLVPLSGLSDDFYQFDDAHHPLVGTQDKRHIQARATSVEVQMAKVDRFKRQVDFKLATQNHTPPRSDRIRPRR